MADAPSIKAELRSAFRDFEVWGVPASGAHKPVKPAVRAALEGVVDFIDEIGSAASASLEAIVTGPLSELDGRIDDLATSVTASRRVYATLAERDTWTDRPAGALAYVEATEASYRWSGSAWVVFSDPTLEAAARALASAESAQQSVDGRARVTQVPGRAVPSADVAFDVVNAAGEQIFAVMQNGDVVQSGRPTLEGGFRFATADGALIAGRNHHGVEPEAEAYDAWIRGGQAYLYALGSVFQLTAGSTYSYIKADVRGGLLSLVRSDDERITTPLAGAYPAAFASAKTVEYSDQYGQSNGAGNAATVKTTANPNARFLMFGAGQRAFGQALGVGQLRTDPLVVSADAIQDIVPGHETAAPGAGETSNSGFARVLLAGSTALATSVLLTTASAVGSANMAMLRPNATEAPAGINTVGSPWRNLAAKFRRAALFSRLQGKAFVAGPLRYNQGEGNYADTKANFLNGLIALRDGWSALALEWNALRATGGHVGKAPLITTQMVNGNKYGAITSQVPWAQLQINLDDPTTALCCGPMYDQAHAADGVHLSALGQEMQGARQAVAYGEWLKGNLWRPLCVRKDAGFAPSRSGATVTLKLWNHFNLPLTFDTATITGLGADQGFRWYDNGDGNSVTVTNAVITDSTTVTLTLSAVPTGTGGAIDVAMNGTSLGNAGPTTGNRSTLRTNGSGVSVDGRPVEHFICIDRIPVA